MAVGSRGPFLQLLGRDVLEVCGDKPGVPERVGDAAHAGAAKLISERQYHLGVGGHGWVEHAIRIFDV